jgi:hypothetical protein
LLSALSSQRHLAWAVELSDDEDDESEGSEDGATPAAEASGLSAPLTTDERAAAAAVAVAAAAAAAAAATAAAVGGGGAASGVFEKAVADILVTGWAKKDPVEALLMEVRPTPGSPFTFARQLLPKPALNPALRSQGELLQAGAEQVL